MPMKHINFFALFVNKDEALEERDQPAPGGKVEYTGRVHRRICLVLDCLTPHDYSTKTADLVNLQHYVVREKKIGEKEAVVIFCDIVRVVEMLHQVCSCKILNLCQCIFFLL